MIQKLLKVIYIRLFVIYNLITNNILFSFKIKYNINNNNNFFISYNIYFKEIFFVIINIVYILIN